MEKVVDVLYYDPYFRPRYFHANIFIPIRNVQAKLRNTSKNTGHLIALLINGMASISFLSFFFLLFIQMAATFRNNRSVIKRTRTAPCEG